MNYERLSPDLCAQIEAERAGREGRFACPEKDALRRNPERDRANAWRPAFLRDIDKILHSAYYNRYADKTQVFSFYKNDDMTRRALHVQFVSRIARSIGGVLSLNCDLIEAIALGHDIGHTPFGHAGEALLSALYRQECGKVFLHNVQSVRVLDGIFPYNITLQTLNGILSHNGEIEMAEYRPRPMTDFAAFDREMTRCLTDAAASAEQIPSTLEGCVVRIADIIAYLGKDRQDAVRAGLLPEDFGYACGQIGTTNAEIINNLTVNILENSYGKDAIRMDEAHFRALQEAKIENYQVIYGAQAVKDTIRESVAPMMEQMFAALLAQAKERDRNSLLYQHHVSLVEQTRAYYGAQMSYAEETDPATLVVDYIASMTDDYFVDLYRTLFPKSRTPITYRGYFD